MILLEMHKENIIKTVINAHIFIKDVEITKIKRFLFPSEIEEVWKRFHLK